MTNLKSMIDALKDVGGIVGGITAAIIAVTALIAAILKLFGELGRVWDEVVRPLWNRILKPFLRFAIISATLAIPTGIIMWCFIYWVAEYWTALIKDPEVFLFIVITSTGSVCIYSLLWGMWLYPAIIRPRFRKWKESTQQLTNNEQGIQPSDNEEGGES